MGDEEAEYKYTFKGGEEEEEKNWLAKPGAAAATYPNGDSFDGTFNAERMKEGEGTYNWVTRDEEDEVKPLASFAGTFRGRREADSRARELATLRIPNLNLIIP